MPKMIYPGQKARMVREADVPRFKAKGYMTEEEWNSSEEKAKALEAKKAEAKPAK